MPSRPDVPLERLISVLTPVVAASGLDLDDVVVRPAGKRLLVRVVVDADGGATLDAVAAVSGPVGDAIDASGALGETAYVLEVTSPGVDRPLSTPTHWRRAAGRLVEVTPRQGAPFTGRVMTTDDSGAVLDLGKDDRRVAYADVAKAVVQVEFGRAAAGDDDSVEEV